MSEPRRIAYLTDDPTPRYNAGLDRAKDPTALRAFLREWPTLAPDAIAAARSIKPADWPEWRRGLQSERKGTFSGEAWAERFGAILMPERMMRASMLADQFVVPWGVAWIRLTELHLLDGRGEAGPPDVLEGGAER
jgi:hypothetical protein